MEQINQPRGDADEITSQQPCGCRECHPSWSQPFGPSGEDLASVDPAGAPRVSIQVCSAACGVQGLPVTASRMAVMTLMPCLRTVEM